MSINGEERNVTVISSDAIRDDPAGVARFMMQDSQRRSAAAAAAAAETKEETDTAQETKEETESPPPRRSRRLSGQQPPQEVSSKYIISILEFQNRKSEDYIKPPQNYLKTHQTTKPHIFYFIITGWV